MSAATNKSCKRETSARRVSSRLTPDKGYLGYPFFYRIAIRRKKQLKSGPPFYGFITKRPERDNLGVK